MDKKEMAALREQMRQEILQELEEKEQTRAELREQVRGEVEAELQARFERRQKLTEFAQEICGGEAGLSAKPEEVVAVLEALPEDQVEAAQKVLRAKVVDFSERGSDRGGQAGKKQLGPEMASALRGWLDSEQALAEFFAVNREELGEMADYDLSEFEKE